MDKKPIIMESLSLIEGKSLDEWRSLLHTILANQISLMKEIRNLNPLQKYNNIPDYISVENAAKKYGFSRTTIHNKINLFFKIKGKEIDRIQRGASRLINELELLEAFKMESPIPLIFRKKK